MEFDDHFRRLFKLSESMESAIVFEADELGCDEEELLDAICCAWLWSNTDHLKSLYKNRKKK